MPVDDAVSRNSSCIGHWHNMLKELSPQINAKHGAFNLTFNSTIVSENYSMNFKEKTANFSSPRVFFFSCRMSCMLLHIKQHVVA